MHFLIVDDHFGARGGMALALKSIYADCQVHEARGVQEAIVVLEASPSISLVLLDLNVDDSQGINTLKTLKRWCEEHDVNPRIVVVSAAADYDDTLIPEAIEHCATGFITKSESEEVFRSAINLTLAGSIFIPASYLRSQRPRSAKVSEKLDVNFTQREKQVAALLVEGLTYKQIAKRLEAAEPGRAMSDNTVRVHVQRMAWKLRLTDPSQNETLSAKSAVLTAFADQNLRFSVTGAV